VSTTTGTNTVTRRIVTKLSRNVELTTTIVSTLASGVTAAANLIALCWFGMWMGLTSRNANFATLKTLAFVQIVPVMVIWFASTLGIWMVLMPIFWKAASTSGSTTAYFALWPVLSAAAVCILSVAKDIGFIIWSRRRLYHSFREQAARSFDQPRQSAPPPVPNVAPPPPAPPSPVAPPLAPLPST